MHIFSMSCVILLKGAYSMKKGSSCPLNLKKETTRWEKNDERPHKMDHIE